MRCAVTPSRETARLELESKKLKRVRVITKEKERGGRVYDRSLHLISLYLCLGGDYIVGIKTQVVESGFVTSVLMTFMYNVYMIQETCAHVHGVTYKYNKYLIGPSSCKLINTAITAE